MLYSPGPKYHSDMMMVFTRLDCRVFLQASRDSKHPFENPCCRSRLFFALTFGSDSRRSRTRDTLSLTSISIHQRTGLPKAMKNLQTIAYLSNALYLTQLYRSGSSALSHHVETFRTPQPRPKFCSILSSPNPTTFDLGRRGSSCQASLFL